MKNKTRELRKHLGVRLHDIAIITDIYSRRIGRLEEIDKMPIAVKDFYKLCIAYEQDIEDFFPEQTAEIREFIDNRKKFFKHRWREAVH